ncbi:hypothetical protein ODS41_11680 [Pyrobaculum sp. 3827-6]|uniref:hypothetical protein n=1 Tax=Pyrobaculum sp. 3827-6 TaxID=2983604 RepID=UPI0021D956AA|nr:hypothetical protein [Pyrobaculum sp. 3827-6]MCU7788572.1 hypothetical protein [Pyrobaculum sp. 3827-6]
MNALKKIRRLETAAKLAPALMLGATLLAGQALAGNVQPNTICIEGVGCIGICFPIGPVLVCL